MQPKLKKIAFGDNFKRFSQWHGKVFYTFLYHKKVLTFLLCFLLCFEQSGFAQIAGQLDISGHLAAFRNTLIPDTFRPLHLRFLQYNSLNNSFQLFLDKGSLKNPRTQELEDTTKTLLNYFFIGITLPNDTFWVNLRPDAEDNIIDEQLAQTDIGKILLESDLQLKKDTARFTSPETPEGKEYWDKLYKKAGEIFGSENIAIPTLTRPWIVPAEIIIRETLDSAYIYKATLKVMLEQDYLKDSAIYNFKDERLKELNEYSSQLIRELIIPKLNKEINSSKRYAPLRQVYYSLIMAQWFKARHKGLSPKGTVPALIDSRDLTNLTSKESWSKNTYFKEYQKSFKDGEYNIQEPIYTPYGQTIRTYVSGGITLANMASVSFGGSSPVVKSVPAAASPVLSPKVGIAIRIKGEDNLGWLSEIEGITASSPAQEKALQRTSFIKIVPDREEIIAMREPEELGPIKISEMVAEGERDEGKIPTTAASSPNINSRHLDTFESVLRNKGVDSIYLQILSMLKQLILDNPALIRRSTLDALNELLDRPLQNAFIYSQAAQVIVAIARKRPDLIDQSVLRTLKNRLISMTGSWMPFKNRESAVREIAKAIAEITISREDLAPQSVAWLETIIAKEGNDGFVYLACAEAIKHIRTLRPKHIKPDSLSAVLLSLRDEVRSHSLPHYLIFLNPHFKNITLHEHDAKRYSIALATYRLLLRRGIKINDPVDPRIDQAVDTVLTLRSAISSRVLLGAETSVINIAHQEERFDVSTMEAMAQTAAAQQIRSFKGSAAKTLALDAIKTTEGSLTVMFNGHGGRNHVWLDEGLPGSEDSDSLQNPAAISYAELGDALMERGKLGEIAILIDACRSYNFSVNLLRYLYTKGATQYPIVVSSSNYDRLSYGNAFIEGLSKPMQDKVDQPITMHNVFSTETWTFNQNDPAVFVQADHRMPPLTYESTPSRDNIQPRRELIASNLVALKEDSDFKGQPEGAFDQLPPDVMEASSPIIEENVISSPMLINEPRLGILAFTMELSDMVKEIRSSVTPYRNVIEIWVAAETGVDASKFIATMIDTLKGEYSDWIVRRADDLEASLKIGNRMVIHEYPEKVRPLEITSSYFFKSAFYGNKIILINLMASDAYLREHSIYGTNIKFVPAPSEGDLSRLWVAATKASSPMAPQDEAGENIIGRGPAGEIVGELAKKFSIMFLGERIHGSKPKNKILSELFLVLKAKRYTHLLVELDAGYQHLIANRDFEAITKEFGLSLNPEFGRIVESALESGLKVVAADKQVTGQGNTVAMDASNRSFVQTIHDILRENPEAKIAILIGAAHLEKKWPGSLYQWAQKNRWNFVSIVFDAEDDNLTYQTDVAEPTAIKIRGELSTLKTKDVSPAPYGDIGDYIIVLPFRSSTGLGPAPKNTPPLDTSGENTSSPINTIGENSISPGGIDFRSLPIVTQAMSNLSGMLRDSPLRHAEGGARGQSLLKVNLDGEWQQIERMASSGIAPSSERIKEYIQISCAQDNIIQDRDKILLCISDILRLEEERCDPTDATLRDILVVLESMSNAHELRQVFLGTIS